MKDAGRERGLEGESGGPLYVLRLHDPTIVGDGKMEETRAIGLDLFVPEPQTCPTNRIERGRRGVCGSQALTHTTQPVGDFT